MRRLSGLRFPGLVILMLSLLCTPTFCQETSEPDSSRKKLVAVHIEEGALVVDGEFTEPEWELAEVAGDFIQNEPLTGQPASEPTEVRVLYDKDNLYIGAICYDSAGEKGFVVRGLK